MSENQATLTENRPGVEAYPGRTLLLDCLPVAPIADAAEDVTTLVKAFDPPSIGHGARANLYSVTPNRVYAAARISPLVMRILADDPEDPVTYDQVRAQASDIIRVIPFASPLLMVPGARSWIAKRAPDKLRALVQKPGPTRDAIARGLVAVMPFAQVIEQFDKPHEQMGQELDTAMKHVQTVARNVRGSKTGSHRNIDRHITAEDAAIGIEDLTRVMLAPAEQHPTYLPMLRALARTALARARKDPQSIQLPERDKLAVVAPEIVHALDYSLPTDRRNANADFVESVRMHTPFWLRTGAEFAYSRKIDAVYNAVPTLLRSLHNLMPARGSDVSKILQRLRSLLLPVDAEQPCLL